LKPEGGPTAGFRVDALAEMRGEFGAPKAKSTRGVESGHNLDFWAQLLGPK
jgi:hypothetical protein